MADLVDDLSLLARIDSGRPLAHESVDLSVLCVEGLADAQAAGPEQRWSLDIPPDPVVVHGDEGRLQQVLANLLTNARVHTPAGTEVDVRLSRAAHGVVLTVSDNGPGIPEALQGPAGRRLHGLGSVHRGCGRGPRRVGIGRESAWSNGVHSGVVGRRGNSDLIHTNSYVIQKKNTTSSKTRLPRS